MIIIPNKKFILNSDLFFLNGLNNLRDKQRGFV